MQTPILPVSPLSQRQQIMDFIRAHPPDRYLFRDEDGDFEEDTFLEQQQMEVDCLPEARLAKILTLIGIFNDFKYADGESPTAVFGLAYLYILDGKVRVVGAT